MKDENILKTIITISIISISFTLVQVENINIIFNEKTTETTNNNPQNTPKASIDTDSKNRFNPKDKSEEEEYELNIPIELCDLVPIDGEFEFKTEPITDVYENEYDAYFHVFLQDMNAQLKKVNAQYALNGKYSFFTGTLFTDKDEGINSAYKMKVYVNKNNKGNKDCEVCIYTSPIIKLKTKPKKFKVPISGVDFMNIVFCFVDGNNSGSVGGFACTTHACLYNAKLIP